MSIELAVIGGTGVYRFPGLEDIERHHVDTPYGKPSGDTVVGTIAGKRVAFMARHGEGHSIAPHRINYRANVWTLLEARAPGDNLSVEFVRGRALLRGSGRLSSQRSAGMGAVGE